MIGNACFRGSSLLSTHCWFLFASFASVLSVWRSGVVSIGFLLPPITLDRYKHNHTTQSLLYSSQSSSNTILSIVRNTQLDNLPLHIIPTIFLQFLSV
jgi:hypothetical protein